MLGIFIPSVDATMISLKIVDTTEVPVLIVLVLTLLRDPFFSSLRSIFCKKAIFLTSYRPIGVVILRLNEPFGHTFLALHLDAELSRFANPLNRKLAERQNFRGNEMKYIPKMANGLN